jgi:hypothetical protein
MVRPGRISSATMETASTLRKGPVAFHRFVREGVVDIQHPVWSMLHVD